MEKTVSVGKGSIRLIKGDITDLEVEAFVFYARHDLQLGSGYGTAITMRGGPSVQEELDEIGSAKTTEVVITRAGEMKAKHIVHAVGPRFQEEEIESKLKTTIMNVFSEAEKAGLKQIAFPPMGAGFYGVPLPVSAEITVGCIADYLEADPKITDIVICALDNREYKPLDAKLSSLGQPQAVAS
jgi:O-acetyl-ADP-ribose deacetylase (regulator of RNase III)